MEELKLLAVTMGLPSTATLADVQGKIAELQSLRNENDLMKAELKAFKEAKITAQKVEITTLLDAAVTENRITQAQRPVYEKLFAADFDSTKALVDGLPKTVKLSEFPGTKTEGQSKFSYNGKTFSQLSKEEPGTLETLKANDPETFKQLYKAEFGKDYKVTEN